MGERVEGTGRSRIIILAFPCPAIGNLGKGIAIEILITFLVIGEFFFGGGGNRTSVKKKNLSLS